MSSPRASGPAGAHRAVTFTYAAVDEIANPDEAVIWQEQVNAWPAIRAYKEHTYALVVVWVVALISGDPGPSVDPDPRFRRTADG